MSKESSISIFITIPLFLLCLLLSIVLVPSLLFSINVPLHPIFLAFSIILAVFFFFIIYKYNKIPLVKRSIKSILLISAVTISVAMVISYFIYDKSWDGVWYHQEGVIKLSEGWVPNYEVLPEKFTADKFFDHKEVTNLWINHYPRFLEIYAASLFIVFNDIEIGKSLMFILMAASFFCVFEYFKNTGRINNFWIVLISAVTALNPVFLTQFLSYYNDGIVASLFTIMVFSAFLLYQNSNKSRKAILLINIAICFIILINVKFTGLVYGCIFFTGIFLYSWVNRLPQMAKNIFISGGVSLVIGIFIIGYSPYLINTINHKHPFYPLAGEEQVDILTFNSPKEFIDKNRLTKLWVSTFSASANIDYASNQKTAFKVPFTLKLEELKCFQGEGTRIAGFGPLWSGIVIFSLAILILNLKQIIQKKPYKSMEFFMIFIIMATVLINPESWWARYVPQLWLIPILIFIIVFQSTSRFNVVNRSLFLAMAINIVLVISPYLYSNFVNTRNLNTHLKHMKSMDMPISVNFGKYKAHRVKLINNNIDYTEVTNMDSLVCGQWIEVCGMNYCGNH